MIDAKLSSVSTRSAASRVTAVPPLPIAIPMWASRSAGASLTPSPVIATTAPRVFQPLTICSFSAGVVRAWTWSFTDSLASTRPSSRAIAAAVSG